MRKAVIVMSKTTFEKIGIPYEERDGIFYPVLVAGTEKADIEAGKYIRCAGKTDDLRGRPQNVSGRLRGSERREYLL